MSQTLPNSPQPNIVTSITKDFEKSQSKKIEAFQKLRQDMVMNQVKFITDTSSQRNDQSSQMSIGKLLNDQKMRNTTLNSGDKFSNSRNLQYDLDSPAHQTIQRHRTYGKRSDQDFNVMQGSTFINQSQLKKTKGFQNWDHQLFRQDMTKLDAHDKRFEAYNYFPKNCTDNAPVPQVDFNKMTQRDDLVYKTVSCGESLYDHRFMNKTSKKDKGIHQFSKSVVKREDEENYKKKIWKLTDNTFFPCHCSNATRFSEMRAKKLRDAAMGPIEFDVEKLQSSKSVMKQPDHKTKMASTGFQSQPKQRKQKFSPLKSIFNSNNQVTQDFQGRKVMVGVDYRDTSLHYRRGVKFDNVIPNQIDTNKEYPGHLQQTYGRIGMSTTTCHSFKLNSGKGTSFLEPRSTLNMRSDFRVDPSKAQAQKTKRFIEGDKPKQKNQTFNQLLTKFGYI